MNNSGSGNTIKKQVQKGYLMLITISAFIVLSSVLLMGIVSQGYNQIIRFQEQQDAAQKVITAHYQWLEQLSDSVTTGKEFKGSLDPNSCALGKWINNSADDLEKYPELAESLSGIIEPHKEIHSEASQLTELAKIDRDKAYEEYSSEFKPKVMIIESGLSEVSASYQSLADSIKSQNARTVLFSTIFLLALGVISIISSLTVGNRLAVRIARPILAVARWSEQLSTGVDNLHFESEELDNGHNALEINRMIQSFQIMSDNIKNHVEVIKKIADGDLTAYVDIKSDGDSLGRSLYHLVQNNDFMFARLLRIADSVAGNANQIAISSQVLAENSTNQAGAVEHLSLSVGNADKLAVGNADNANNVSQLIDNMSPKIQAGQEKMDQLISSVREIVSASQKISLVMKSINDIAFQTNILSLNAAVEAARAGEAGKGFAVVADEVRQLALKSAEAAEQSRNLIDNTITKANEGGKISSEASSTFQDIVNSVREVSENISKIDKASTQQRDLMKQIHDEINRISSSVTENAASSEETAASTVEMNKNAEQIHVEMRKFNLRKREEGRPYIPPEKENDENFIREATENFLKAKSGI